MSSTENVVLSIAGLSKAYGHQQAVTDLQFKVEKGQIYGLLGENGAGKTTTLKMITGIIEKNQGTIEIGNYSIDIDPVQAKKRVFYVPDHAVLFENMRGDHYFKWMCQLYEVNFQSALIRQQELVSEFGMTSHMEKEIGEMSLGTKQKLLLITGLAINPPLLILDEPMVGLDAVSIVRMKAALTNYAHQGGAVLFSTHLLHIAQQICTHISILKNGRLIYHTCIEALEDDLEPIFMGMMKP